MGVVVFAVDKSSLQLVLGLLGSRWTGGSPGNGPQARVSGQIQLGWGRGERPSERISVPNLGLEWFADKINGICRNNTFTNASYALVAAPIVAQAAILDGESDQRGHNFKFGTFLG